MKFSGNSFAYASLGCSLSFWLWASLGFIPTAPRLNFLTAEHWLVILAVAVILAGVAAARRSKLWPLAILLVLGTFIFLMYGLAA